MSTEGLRRAWDVSWRAQRSSFLGGLRSYVRFTELPRTAAAKVVNVEENRKAHCKRSAPTQKPALRKRMP